MGRATYRGRIAWCRGVSELKETEIRKVRGIHEDSCKMKMCKLPWKSISGQQHVCWHARHTGVDRAWPNCFHQPFWSLILPFHRPEVGCLWNTKSFFEFLCVIRYIRMYTHTQYIYIYIYIHSIYIYIHTYIHSIYIYYAQYIYTYIYIYTHTQYIYIYIHTHTHTQYIYNYIYIYAQSV